MFNKKNNKKESGFTLVETLVAIAIFATSITGLISITARGINDNVFVKNKLTASYLAMEGVEIIRNLRDASMSNPGFDWDSFISDTNNGIGHCFSFGTDTNECYIYPISFTILPCDENCPIMSFDQDTGLYGYDSTIANSPFTRHINVREISSGTEIQITSTVKWSKGSAEHEVSYQYNLLNWF